HHLAHGFTQRVDAGAESLDFILHVQIFPAIAQEPCDSTFDDAKDFLERRELHLRRHAVIQRFDLLPDIAEAIGTEDDHKGLDDLFVTFTGFGYARNDKNSPHAIDERIDDLRGDDFAAQFVVA